MRFPLHPNFFDTTKSVVCSRANLPHWEQDSCTCFVTFRLADSIPQEKLKCWKIEREDWLNSHPKPWDERIENEYYKRFGKAMESYLDAGFGACVLQNRKNREHVESALRHFDEVRYRLHAFVVMPNHVHVLFEPIRGCEISEILRSWKRYSAREINKHQGTKGSLWQKEYWDRYVRSVWHFERVIRYIEQNSLELSWVRR